ncbi:LysE family translocator [Spirillospora sp. NPDC050679]
MPTALWVFAAASLLVSMAPGPTTIVIIRQTLRAGRSAGVATVLGNETGWLLWSLAAALGLSALLLASRVAFDVLRVAGAVALVWFGARALWQARRAGPPEDAEPVGRADVSRWRCYRLGLFTNLANPKAGVFALSFLPQFVPDGVAVPPMLLLLALASAVIDFAWYLVVVFLVCGARRLFRRAAVRRGLERLSGVALVVLGVRLAAEG